MPGQQPNNEENPNRRVAVFDESGGDIPEHEEDNLEAPADPNAVRADDGETDPDPAPKKYRIGDQEFDTLEEAHAYATNRVSTLETETQISDAYRRGIEDAQRLAPAAPGVTPAAEPQKPKFDMEKYYADPEAFLAEFAEKIRNESVTTVVSAQAQREINERIWNNFCARHPDLAEFREDVDQIAAQVQTELKAIAATKGDAAAFDFVALKLKAKFAKIKDAMKPRKELPNGGTGTTPSGTSGVTPKKPAPKVLSMKEQIANMKAKRR